uniref:Coiled-coil domain-containing protein 137 n=1 Tax=Caenorhabditis tropicalis TaxID=1561998 RepID=A0A1I7SZN7_9PELO
MRLSDILFLVFTFIGLSDGFQPVFSKISVRKSDHAMEQTTEDPDAALSNYDPFDLDDASFFADLSNSSKRIKLQLETAQFIQKFGAQELLNIILHKVQNVNLPHDSKGAINDFLDFVEDLIYSNAAERIEKKLQMDLTRTNSYQKKAKIHMGEATKTVYKQKIEYGDEKDHRRRDAPALSQNAILIEEDENYPAVRQPLEPTKMMFLSHSEPNFLRDQLMVGREIRRAPMKIRRKTRLTKAQLEKAIKSAEREAREAEMEKILKKRRAQLKERRRIKKQREMAMKKRRASKTLPLTRIQDDQNSVRRSPIGRVTFNEKMFQLLDEYGIKSFRVETADYTVRAFADPEKTRFSSINLLDVPMYNDAIRRKPSRPPFVYSRTIQTTKPVLRRPTQKRLVQKRRKSISLDRLL